MGSNRDPARPVPTHRLRPNETVWTPASVIVLDTETEWRVEGTSELHTLRLWVAVHVDRRHVRKTQGPVCWGWGNTPGELAEWLTGRTRGRDSVWVYAHNLNFDLVTTNLVETMSDHDWTVTDFSVSNGAPWLRLKRGSKVLTVVDSWTWLPESVESLATRMGRSKVPLPANDDGEIEWWQRCASDVDLTARSVLGLMDWWDGESLGRWSISGAGSGWNAMRHTESGERHVIQLGPDPDELQREARWVRRAVDAGREWCYVDRDRTAVRGGRKDAAVVRSATGGPWVELDLVKAYPTVARDLPLPVKRGWTFDSLPVDSKWIGSRFWGVIADCRVRTDRPRYPVRHGGVTWYPVGEFRTTLAGPELRWARDNGDLVEVGAGQAHRLGFALRPWATWVLDPSRGGTVDVPPVAEVACKVWGRSVLGKFAGRVHRSEPLEGAAPAGWSVTDMWDRPSGRRGAEVTMGGSKWLVTYDGDGENCYPAVLAWVESEVRVRLGKVLEALDGAWWTADTDGLLVDLSGPIDWLRWGVVRLGDHARDPFGLGQSLCDQLEALTRPLTLRPKRVFESLAVLGPQHLIAGDVRKMSGVRASSEQTAPYRFVGRDWPKLKWQMNNSRPGVYTRPERVSTFNAPTVHRWVTGDGAALPAEFRIGPDGSNELVPWALTRWARDGAELAPAQYRILARVV